MADKQVGTPGSRGGQLGASALGTLSANPAGLLGRRSPACLGPAYRWLSEASRGRASARALPPPGPHPLAPHLKSRILGSSL